MNQGSSAVDGSYHLGSLINIRKSEYSDFLKSTANRRNESLSHELADLIKSRCFTVFLLSSRAEVSLVFLRKVYRYSEKRRRGKFVPLESNITRLRFDERKSEYTTCRVSSWESRNELTVGVWEFVTTSDRGERSILGR